MHVSRYVPYAMFVTTNSIRSEVMHLVKIEDPRRTPAGQAEARVLESTPLHSLAWQLNT